MMAEGCESRSHRAIKLNFRALLCWFLLKFGESGGTDSEQNAETLKHFAAWTFHYLFVVFYFGLVCQNPFYLVRRP